MRIAYVCSDPGIALDGTKGAAIHVREMARAMADLGHELRIFMLRPGDPPRDSTLKAVVLEPDAADVELRSFLRDDPSADEPLRWTLRAMLGASGFRHRLREAFATWRPDLVYERYALFGSAGSTVAAESAIPHVLEVNAPLTDEHERHRDLGLPHTARALERAILRRADLVIAVSDPLRSWLVGEGVAPSAILVLPNGVDVDRFAPSPGTRAELRATLGWPDAFVVGFVGSLRPWHDVDGLLRAAAQLTLSGADVRVLVVGDGPGRAALGSTAEALGIGERVAFTGAVPHPDVARYLAAMDVAIAPYTAHEDLYFSPLKVFEYMASGLPVVAADAGDMGCCVVEGSTGWRYAPGDTGSLVAALGRALASGQRSELGALGRQHVKTRHTWQGNARQVLAVVPSKAGVVVKPAAGAGLRARTAEAVA